MHRYTRLGGAAPARTVESARQQGEVRLGEFLSPLEQAHGDEEVPIEKKRTPEFLHPDRVRHGGDVGQGKDAERKSGGPRYSLAAFAILRLLRLNNSPTGIRAFRMQPRKCRGLLKPESLRYLLLRSRINKRSNINDDCPVGCSLAQVSEIVGKHLL